MMNQPEFDRASPRRARHDSRGKSGLFAIALAVLAGASGLVARAEEPASGNMQTTTTKTIEQYLPPYKAPVASLELQPEVTVSGGEVTLKQICKWPEGDTDMLAEYADLVIVRIEPGAAFANLSIEQIQSVLRDAGMNPASVNFAGAASCRVARGDVNIDEAEALRDWMSTSHGDVVIADAGKENAVSPDHVQAKGDDAPKNDVDPAVLGDLRARLIHDLATRLNLRPDTMQIEFSPEDQKVLALNNPSGIAIEPQRASDLGNVSWLVTISNGNDSKRVRIAARARAWIDQTVVARPLSLRQTITETDIETKRILADRLPTDVLVTSAQVIGQQAARDLKVGSVLTGKLLAPVEFVRPGQLVTVLMRRGAIEIKSVARALQAGSAGQNVKVKNEATGELFQVQLIGPQLATLSGSDPVADISN